MPPKKKRKVNPGAPPGVARLYLQDNFSDFPTEPGDVKIGHILLVYITSGEFSGTECNRQLKTLLVTNLGYSELQATDYCFKVDIQRIVRNSLEKYRRLGDANELAKFMTVCSEPYIVPAPGTDDPLQGHSSPEPSNSQGITHTPEPKELSTPVTSTATRTSRSRSLDTPRKGKLRKRFQFVSSHCRHRTKMIYLDYNATTPLEEEVLQAITETLKEAWGNPSSSYEAGVKAKSVIKQARKNVAEMIGACDNDIVFTSGGTEANNMILQTALKHFAERKLQTENNGPSHALPHFITSNLEHDSIKLVLEQFERDSLAETGRVEVDDVSCAIRNNTIMVTIMMANNETGILQPISEICEKILQINKTRSGYEILLHTDAAQAIGKVKVDVEDLQVDYLTVVGHKFYAPRIGALYARGIAKETPLYPMFYGGGQERNFRPGTENTGMIAGLGKAAELVVKNLKSYEEHMRKVRDHLELRLQEEFPNGIHFNGKLPGSERLPNTCNVSIKGEGLQGNKILGNCQSTQASVGAACHSGGNHRASSILLAIGIPENIAINALRLSVGRYTTISDIEVVIEDLKGAVSKLS